MKENNQMKTENEMKLKKLDYHRNGVAGLGFHVGIVEHDGEEMLVIRFPKECDSDVSAVLCAAFDLKQLDKRVIEFGANSFRGDHFSEFMDSEIEKKNANL